MNKIVGKEIFSVGEWNGDEYTKKDLEEMVATFEATSQNYKPYIKLGHDDDQKLLQNDGLPSAGWVENLRIKGDKLICDIVDIPGKVFKLIKENAYRYVSSEIFWNITFEGKDYPKMLAGVALLGSDMPAVTNLNDFANLYKFDYSLVHKYTLNNNSKTEDTSVDFKKQIEDSMPNIDQVHVPVIAGEGKQQGKPEDKKELEAAPVAEQEPKVEVAPVEPKAAPIAEIEIEDKKEMVSVEELQAQIAALQEQLKEAQAKAEMACAKNAKFEMELKAKEIENFISANNVAPAAAPFIKELLDDEKKEYSVNDKKLTKSELISEVIKVYSNANVNLVENSSVAKYAITEQESAELAAVKKFAQDNGIDFNKDISKAYKLFIASKNIDVEVDEEE